MASKIQLRRDLAAVWTSVNPILADGEIGIETDTAKYKLGNGTSAWNALAYKGLNGEQGIQGIQGIPGIPGLPGNDGAQGIQGVPGNDGAQGIQGIQGLQGEQGIQGIPGSGGVWGSITGTLGSQTDLNSALSGKAPTTHTHVPTDVTGTAVITNDARLSDARTPLTHTHAIADTTNLQTTLNGKEPANANIQAHVISAHAPSSAQANADITKAEIEAKLIGTISTHSHAGGGGVSPLYIHIAVPVLAATVWTNMPVALSFWLSTAAIAKNVQRVDLTSYTQVRLMVNKQGVAGAAASKLILRYKTAPFTQVVANYSNIGVTEVSVAVNVTNTYLDTGWIDLAEGAKADVFIDLLGSGGDGTLDPVFGTITAVFK
jgi:Major tropism determinant N-terminal domain/Collagen triple helix repeat (20 copies)/Phage tail repeat like